MSKVQGTVKWFSNKSGYGFIEPTSENSPTQEDIFVHQSSIKSDGYRTLSEGWIVAFDVSTDENGKLKADNVTAPDGGPCTGPRRRRRKYDDENTGGDETGAEGGTDTFGTGASGGGSGGEGAGDRPGSSRRSPRKPRKPSENVGGGAGGPRKPQQPIWHDILDPVVKDALQSKGIRRTTGTIDISVGPSRIKLGTREYTSMAHADGILAEGSFNCEANGTIGFLWERALIFADGAWTVHPTHSLLTSLSLADDNVLAVGSHETPETLWGEGKPDPREKLEKAGFQMRRVVLTPRPKAAPVVPTQEMTGLAL